MDCPATHGGLTSKEIAYLASDPFQDLLNDCVILASDPFQDLRHGHLAIRSHKDSIDSKIFCQSKSFPASKCFKNVFFFGVTGRTKKAPTGIFSIYQKKGRKHPGEIYRGRGTSPTQTGASSKRDLIFVQRSNTKSRREKQGDPDVDVLPHDPRKPNTPKDGVVTTSLSDSRECLDHGIPSITMIEAPR
jgi:hypothetical protein